MASMLIKAKCEIDAKRESGCTPLYIAAQKNSLDIMGLLLRSGADVEAKRDNGCTPLHVACEQGHVDAIKLLIHSGAQVRATSSTGWTPLMLSAKKGRAEALRELLRADPFFFSPEGNRTIFGALCVAAKSASCESVEVLLDGLFLNSSAALSLFAKVEIRSAADLLPANPQHAEILTQVQGRRQVGLEACTWMLENCSEDPKINQQALETRMDASLSLFGDLKTALKDASKLIEICADTSPDIRAAYYNCRALILLSQQNLEGAISDAHASLNCLHAQSLKSDEFSVSPREDARATSVSNFLIITEARLKQGNLKQARSFAAKALAMSPPDKQRVWLERVMDMDQSKLDQIILNRKLGNGDTELPPKTPPSPGIASPTVSPLNSDRSSGSSTSSTGSARSRRGRKRKKKIVGVSTASSTPEDTPRSESIQESVDSFYDEEAFDEAGDLVRASSSTFSTSASSQSESTNSSLSSRSGSGALSLSIGSGSSRENSRTANRFVVPPAKPPEEVTKKEQPLLASIARNTKASQQQGANQKKQPDVSNLASKRTKAKERRQGTRSAGAPKVSPREAAPDPRKSKSLTHEIGAPSLPTNTPTSRTASPTVSYATVAGMGTAASIDQRGSGSGSDSLLSYSSGSSSSSESGFPPRVPAIHLPELRSVDSRGGGLSLRELNVPSVLRATPVLPTAPKDLSMSDDILGFDLAFLLGVDLVATLESPFPEEASDVDSSPFGFKTVGPVSFNLSRPLGSARGHTEEPTVFEGVHEVFGAVAVKVMEKRTGRLYPPDLERLSRAAVPPHDPPLLRHHGSAEDDLKIYVFSELGSANLIDYTANMRSSNRLGVPLLYDISRRILRAVAEMHSFGICHKNLKPEKIFIKTAPPTKKSFEATDVIGEQVSIKIGGVGLSSINQSGLQVWGTPGWRAPELNHANADGGSTACDLYSCGLLLTALLLKPQTCDSILANVDLAAAALKALKESENPELFDLLTNLTHRDPALRVPALVAARHCGLWSTLHRLSFFQAILSEHQVVLRHARNRDVVSEDDKLFLEELASLTSSIVEASWRSILLPQLQPPTLTNINDLLHHLEALLEVAAVNIHDVFSSLSLAFPKLFISLYKTASKYWTHKPSLQPYFVY